MKRIIAISATLVCLGSTGARAEEPSGIWRNSVLQETAIRNSLWLGSSSAAGLAFSPYKVFNNLNPERHTTESSWQPAGSLIGTLANTTPSTMYLITNWNPICPTILSTTSPADGKNRNIS